MKDLNLSLPPFICLLTLIRHRAGHIQAFHTAEGEAGLQSGARHVLSRMQKPKITTQGTELWPQAAPGLIPAPLLVSCVVMAKLVNLSEPSFPHLATVRRRHNVCNAESTKQVLNRYEFLFLFLPFILDLVFPRTDMLDLMRSESTVRHNPCAQEACSSVGR